MYASYNDIVYSSAMSGRMTVEDLIDVSKVVEKPYGICCIIDREMLYDKFLKGYNGSRAKKDFDSFVDFVLIDEIAVESIYFNINTKQFEKQVVRFVLGD